MLVIWQILFISVPYFWKVTYISGESGILGTIFVFNFFSIFGSFINHELNEKNSKIYQFICLIDRKLVRNKEQKNETNEEDVLLDTNIENDGNEDEKLIYQKKLKWLSVLGAFMVIFSLLIWTLPRMSGK